MAAVMLIPVYLLINLYVLYWFLKWLSSLHPILKKKRFLAGIFLIYFFFSTTILTSFLFERPLWLHRILKPLSNFFLGYFLYAIIFVFLFHMASFFLKRTALLKNRLCNNQRIFMATGFIALLLIIVTGTYGYFHQKKINVREYTVTIHKSLKGKDHLRIALVSDLHLGYSVGEETVRTLVARINEANADLVCFAGDTFDNEFEAVQNPNIISNLLAQIESTYGTFSCFGNHDMDEPLLGGFSIGHASKGDDSKMIQFFKNSDIHLLNDEALCIDDSFYLVGRKDSDRAEKIENGRLSPEQLLGSLDQEKPIIVLDHQPDQLSDLSLSGADLDLSGHTHNGQIFPENLIIRLFWENPYGMLKVNEMTSIVTSGAGIWGPNMRVGTDSELAVIDVNFTGKF